MKKRLYRQKKDAPAKGGGTEEQRLCFPRANHDIWQNQI